MAAGRSTTDRSAPRFRHCLVSVAKKVSTALSQEHEVGVKWRRSGGGGRAKPDAQRKAQVSYEAEALNGRRSDFGVDSADAPTSRPWLTSATSTASPSSSTSSTATPASTSPITT